MECGCQKVLATRAGCFENLWSKNARERDAGLVDAFPARLRALVGGGDDQKFGALVSLGTRGRRRALFRSHDGRRLRFRLHNLVTVQRPPECKRIRTSASHSTAPMPNRRCSGRTPLPDYEVSDHDNLEATFNWNEDDQQRN